MDSRRHDIENIIIGTLLEGGRFYEDCRSMVTSDMFKDQTNRRIYNLIVEMNEKGKNDTTPCGIFEEYGPEIVDIVPRMCELVADWSFIHKKTKYNEVRYLYGLINGMKAKRTDVRFSDYVMQFIKRSLEDDKESGDRRRGEAHAA